MKKYSKNLEIYNKLRKFHKEVEIMLDSRMTSRKFNALEGLYSILYLLEEMFSFDESLTEDDTTKRG